MTIFPAFDMDGTILNYSAHNTETRFNTALPALLNGWRGPCAILTNQGGIAFHTANPGRYPSPLFVAQRISAAGRYLNSLGCHTRIILASCWHPKASETMIQSAAQHLRDALTDTIPQNVAHTVYTTERARKPNPFMLRVARSTVYFGDSPEDEAAAQAAGIQFVHVERFL